MVIRWRRQAWAWIAVGLTIAAIVPFKGGSLAARALTAGTTLAQNVLARPDVRLILTADRRQVNSVGGTSDITWQPLPGEAPQVQPGDVLRYTLTARNQGKGVAKNLVVTQPIPDGTIYILNSTELASGSSGTFAYSIDGGQTYSPTPTVSVTLPDGTEVRKPAPASAYTHVQVKFTRDLEPDRPQSASYQVKVR